MLDNPRLEDDSQFILGNGLYEIVAVKHAHPRSGTLTLEAIFLDCLHEDAVKWNPYNKVVSCHRCGHIYIPKKY